VVPCEEVIGTWLRSQPVESSPDAQDPS
jgi:hypothetical protein